MPPGMHAREVAAERAKRVPPTRRYGDGPWRSRGRALSDGEATSEVRTDRRTGRVLGLRSGWHQDG
jgi:hypothetical protein